jgi:hypothetical protein
MFCAHPLSNKLLVSTLFMIDSSCQICGVQGLFRIVQIVQVVRLRCSRDCSSCSGLFRIVKFYVFQDCSSCSRIVVRCSEIVPGLSAVFQDCSRIVQRLSITSDSKLFQDYFRDYRILQYSRDCSKNYSVNNLQCSEIVQVVRPQGVFRIHSS